MKKFLPFLAAAASCSLSLTACGDSSSVEDEPENYGHFREVMSEDELYACTSRYEGTFVFIIDEKKSFKCEEGTWYEIDVEQVDELGDVIKSTLKYAADDTVTSLSMLPACTITTDSMTAYVASLGGYLMCLDYEWMEIDGRDIKLKPRSSSSWDDFFESSSSTDDRFKGYSSGSKIIPIAPSNGDSSCNALTEGTVKSASYYDDYVYLCKSGAWFTVEESSIDMMDLKDTTDGTILPGKVQNLQKAISGYCPAPDTSYEFNMYVFEGGWRAADVYELCFNKACIATNLGDTASMASYAFVCDTTGWRGVDIVKDSISKENFFNKSLTYGTLTDDRDSKTYKTIKIGDYTWMAENLNFADSSAEGFANLEDQSSTVSKDPTGEIFGRQYSYTGAMNLITKYSSYKADSTTVKTHHRGVCPSGWHVPDTTEWRNLITAAGNMSGPLKSSVGWSYYRDDEEFVPTNATGFSALTASIYSDRYCTATQGYYSDEYMVAMIEFDEENVYFDKDLDKDYYCFMRCVMDYEDAEEPVVETSSSETDSVSTSSSAETITSGTSSSEATLVSSSGMSMSSSKISSSSAEVVTEAPAKESSSSEAVTEVPVSESSASVEPENSTSELEE